MKFLLLLTRGQLVLSVTDWSCWNFYLRRSKILFRDLVLTGHLAQTSRNWWKVEIMTYFLDSFSSMTYGRTLLGLILTSLLHFYLPYSECVFQKGFCYADRICRINPAYLWLYRKTSFRTITVVINCNNSFAFEFIALSLLIRLCAAFPD